MTVDGGPEYPATTVWMMLRRAASRLPTSRSRSTSTQSAPTSRSWSGPWTAAPLVYLDSANTSQKPRVVVEAIEDHYLNHNANVARAMHLLGAEATEAFEGARATSRSSSARPARRRSSSPRTPPRRSTSAPTRWARPSDRATRSSSR